MFTKVSLLVSLNIKYFLTQYFYPMPNSSFQLFLLHLLLVLEIYIFNPSDEFSSFVVTKPRDKLLRARQVTVLVVTAMVRPALTYGAIVWWPRILVQTAATKLASVQRLACLAIRGALCSTPGATLDRIAVYLFYFRNWVYL